MNITSYKNLSQDELNSDFINACEKGNNKHIEYLLTSPELVIHADIDYYDQSNQNGIVTAIFHNHLDTVKILLPLYDRLSKYKSNTYHSLLEESAWSGHIDIFKYALTVQNMLNHKEFNTIFNSAFKYICDGTKIEIAEYLIYNYGIKRNKEINNILKVFDRDNIISNIFEKMEFKISLENNLVKNKQKKIKMKI